MKRAGSGAGSESVSQRYGYPYPYKNVTDPEHCCYVYCTVHDQAVLRIRDVYPGSEFFPSRIRIKEFILRPKNFLSFRKCDPGCSSQIPDPEFLSHPGPESWIQGSKKHRIRIRNTVTRFQYSFCKTYFEVSPDGNLSFPICFCSFSYSEQVSFNIVYMQGLG